jgi:hypothetical protein
MRVGFIATCLWGTGRAIVNDWCLHTHGASFEDRLIQATSGSLGGRGRRVNRSGCAAEGDLPLEVDLLGGFEADWALRAREQENLVCRSRVADPCARDGSQGSPASAWCNHLS